MLDLISPRLDEDQVLSVDVCDLQKVHDAEHRQIDVLAIGLDAVKNVRELRRDTDELKED